MADPHSHAAHGHDAHGHDAHGQDAHGGGGHGHDESPRRTPVPPYEATPWGMIALGVIVTALVLGLGIAQDWGKSIKENPKATLGAPGFPAKQ